MDHLKPIEGAPENFNDSFLTIEDLYVAQSQAKDVLDAAPATGSSLRSRLRSPLSDSLWMAKDMPLDSPEFAQIAARVDAVIKGLLESGQKVEVVIASAEKSKLLDPIEALDQARLGARKLPTTEVPDLDYAMEKVMENGAMLEEIATGRRFMKWATEVFDPVGFTPIDAMELPPQKPFVDMAQALAEDLTQGAQGGLRHPNALTLRVGAVTLLLGEGESQRVIPLMRLQRSNNGRKVCDQLYGQAKDYAYELTRGLQEYQGRLLDLPDDWPTEEHYKAAKSVGMERFLGDNGIQENDFYNGSWIRSMMSTELHRHHEEIAQMEIEQAAPQPEQAPQPQEAMIGGPASLSEKLQAKKIAAEKKAPAAPRAKNALS